MALPGGYPNFLARGDGDRAAKAYGRNAKRLIDAKRLYDPANVFWSAIPLPDQPSDRQGSTRSLMAKAIFRSPTQSGNIEMLLFIVLALLVILTKSLTTLVATDVGFSFDAAVAIAGLLSYIGLFGYIFRPQRTAGKSFDCSRRGAALAEGHFETTDHLQQGIAARPAGRPIAGSSSGAEARSGERRPGEATHPGAAQCYR